MVKNQISYSFNGIEVDVKFRQKLIQNIFFMINKIIYNKFTNQNLCVVIQVFLELELFLRQTNYRMREMNA